MSIKFTDILSSRIPMVRRLLILNLCLPFLIGTITIVNFNVMALRLSKASDASPDIENQLQTQSQLPLLGLAATFVNRTPRSESGSSSTFIESDSRLSRFRSSLSRGLSLRNYSIRDLSNTVCVSNSSLRSQVTSNFKFLLSKSRTLFIKLIKGVYNNVICASGRYLRIRSATFVAVYGDVLEGCMCCGIMILSLFQLLGVIWSILALIVTSDSGITSLISQDTFMIVIGFIKSIMINFAVGYFGFFVKDRVHGNIKSLKRELRADIKILLKALQNELRDRNGKKRKNLIAFYSASSSDSNSNSSESSLSHIDKDYIQLQCQDMANLIETRIPRTLFIKNKKNMMESMRNSLETILNLADVIDSTKELKDSDCDLKEVKDLKINEIARDIDAVFDNIKLVESLAFNSKSDGNVDLTRINELINSVTSSESASTSSSSSSQSDSALAMIFSHHIIQECRSLLESAIDIDALVDKIMFDLFLPISCEITISKKVSTKSNLNANTRVTNKVSNFIASPSKPMCFICLSDDDNKLLVSACTNCKGSSKWVHEKCLNEWRFGLSNCYQHLHLSTNEIFDKFIFNCPVCKGRYDEKYQLDRKNSSNLCKLYKIVDNARKLAQCQ